MTRIGRRRAWQWGPAVVWATVVLVASLVDPPGTVTSTTGPFGLLGADKWQHALGYAVLGALTTRAVDGGPGRAVGGEAGRAVGGEAGRAVDGEAGRAALLALVIAIGFGCGVEILQAVVPARTFALADAAANAVGAGVGVATWRFVRGSLPSR